MSTSPDLLLWGHLSPWCKTVESGEKDKRGEWGTWSLAAPDHPGDTAKETHQVIPGETGASLALHSRAISVTAL